jgi:hypothetical protein
MMQGDAMSNDDLAAHARALIDANRYLTLGTADPDGRPWATPVYFAAAGEREYYWVSATDARHSRNLAARPQVSVVVFDSTVAPFHGRAVYAEAEAAEVPGPDLDRALAVYPGPADRGVQPLARDAVTGTSGYRLYRATASRLWVLCPRPSRQPCPLHGVAEDHRALIG